MFIVRVHRGDFAIPLNCDILVKFNKEELTRKNFNEKKAVKRNRKMHFENDLNGRS